jgi:hypothetical protein
LPSTLRGTLTGATSTTGSSAGVSAGASSTAVSAWAATFFAVAALAGVFLTFVSICGSGGCSGRVSPSRTARRRTMSL